MAGEGAGSWLAGIRALVDPRRSPTANLVLVASFVLAVLSFFGPELVIPGRGAVGVGLPSVLGKWQGPEQDAFQAVLQRFQQERRITVNYRGSGDELPQDLEVLIARHQAPDIAILPQPGLLDELVARGLLKPLDAIVGSDLAGEVPPTWRDQATVHGRLYGIYFKAANKSTVWYRPSLFARAGIERPHSYPELLDDMAALRKLGVVPFANCAASGWPLADWFANMYLQVARRDQYQRLAKHQIPWTDPSVTATFTRLNAIFAPAGPASTPNVDPVSLPFPDCMNQLLGTSPQAAMLFEADFVQGTVQYGELGSDIDFFPFPPLDSGAPLATMVGGDVAVLLHDTPQARELIRYLATPEAGTAWARLGGFISPNIRVGLNVYPNRTTRSAAAAIVGSDREDRLVFDMSDQAPRAFGATAGSGEWGDLQRWLENPDDIAGTEAMLERDAAAAYSAPGG